jgi:hypothetical protein
MDIEELRLTYETGMKAFPPRKPEQPIFYPVLNLEYAIEIASRWNTESATGAGYVAKFTVDDVYAARFEPHKVGSSHHTELWVPAEELAEFNEHLIPPILIVNAHFKPTFQGCVPATLGLRGKDAIAQFAALAQTSKYSGMDFRCEIAANNVAVFLNYGFWAQTDFSSRGISKTEQDRVLEAIRRIWSDVFPGIYLPLTDNPVSVFVS